MDQLLNRCSPLQDLLDRNCIHKVVLNIIHNTSQQLEEMLSSSIVEGEFLHKILIVTMNSLRMLQAILRYPVSMEST